jgi:MFS family permease
MRLRAAQAEPTAVAATGEPELGMFGALRQRQFALLWFGGLGQALGMGMQQITLGHFVYDRTSSEFWVGAVAFMNFAPFFLLSPIAGLIGDRMDRRRLLFSAQALSGLAVLALAILITADRVAMWQVLLVALLAATGQATGFPARMAYVNDLVDRRYLMNAVALNSLSQNGARIVGPMVAGLLIGLFGSGGTMYVNASGYLLGLIPLMLLHGRPRRALVERGFWLGEIWEGMRYVWSVPMLFFIVMLGNVFSFFGMVYISMLPVFAEDVLGKGSTGLGMLSSASGVGAVCGSLLLARLGDYPHKSRLMQGFYVLFFVALIGYSVSSIFPVSLALLLIVGLGSMGHINVGTVMLQLGTPPHLQGRVMSLFTWGICLNFLAALPVGALAEVYGAPVVLAGSAVLGLLSGGMLMLWYAARVRGTAAAAAAVS